MDKKHLLPVFSFFVSILITSASYFYLKNFEERLLDSYFHDRVERAERVLHNRIQDYNQILLSLKAFVEESDTVTRAEWKRYFEKIQLDKNYPGIQGIGYSIFIPKPDLQNHINKIREEGYKEYTVKPQGEREIYSSVIYLEPFHGRNLRAFGFDMFNEPIRRKAMEIARDSGQTSLTAKVTLVQENQENTLPGFLLYLPVYKKETHPKSVEERRKLIKGFVYCPFRSYDFFNSIYNQRFPELQIEVFDGDSPTKENLLYDKDFSDSIKINRDSKLSLINKINILGNSWTIKYNYIHGSFFDSEFKLSDSILIGGIIFSFLILILTVLYVKFKSARVLTDKANKTKNFIIESMPEKVTVTDNKGIISYFNKKWLNYTGLSEKDFLQNGWKEVLHPEDQDETEKLLKESYSKSFPYSIQHRLKNKDGEWRWHLSLGTPQVDESGEIVSWIETHTDINEQKSQLEELKKINIDLDNFIYTASHDLRAPVSNLEGLLSIVQAEISDVCKNEVSNYFTMMNKTIQRLKTTINDLTQISRIQRESEKEGELIDIHTLIEEFKEDHKSLINESGANINFNLEVSHIRFSRKNLRSIIYNLLSNAIKYRSDERKVVVELTTKAQKDTIHIIVKDNGLGLKPEQKDKVFGMFKRMHTHVEGSGIGLYIAKRMIENAGGKIELESEEDKGSEFKIILPLKN